MTGYARLAKAVEVPTETGVLPEVFPRKIAGAEGVLMLSFFFGLANVSILKDNVLIYVIFL